MPSYTSIYIHIVFATKHRAPMIADEWRQDLHNYLGATSRELHAKPMIVGGVSDHVHMLVCLKADKCVSDLVREFKKASNAWARERYASFEWQEGYAAFSVGISELKRLTEYIAGQEEHHHHISSEDELRALLLEFGIPIDERYFV